MQVWMLKDNFYIGETKFVEEVTENMTDVPLLVGYIKPYFNGTKWVEGATEEEIKEYKQAQQIDNCSSKGKTLEELTKENEQLWDMVNLLLKKTGMIGADEDATN